MLRVDKVVALGTRPLALRVRERMSDELQRKPEITGSFCVVGDTQPEGLHSYCGPLDETPAETSTSGDAKFWRERAEDLARQLEASEARERFAQERLDWMKEIGVSMARRRSPNDALGVLLDRIVRVVGAQRGVIYLVEPEGDTISARTVVGGRVREIRLAFGEGLAGHCARTRKPINVKDASQDSRWRFVFDELHGEPTRAALCVPMLDTRGELLGVIQVVNRDGGGYFTLADEHLLVSVSSSVAMLMENFRYYLDQMNQNMELMEIRRSLEERVRELDRLHRLQRTMNEALSQEDEVAALAEATFSLLPADAVLLSFVSETGGRRFIVDAATRTTRALDEGSPWYAPMIEGRRPLLLDDVLVKAPLIPNAEGALCAYLGVPLRDNEQIVGGMEVINIRDPREPYTQEHARLLVLVGGQCVRAVVRNQLRRRLESEERIHALGSMLSGVMHDLKTPMSVCSGYVQLLARQDDPAKRQELAQIIRKQIADIHEMTAEVIAYAKGDIQLYERTCDLGLFAEEMERLVQKSLENTKVRASFHVLARGQIRIDEGKLKRIIFNLLRNAFEAIEERGGEIQLLFEGARDEDLFVTVSDDGPGIPPEIRASLFEAFVTSRKASGTGLGLSIVRRLVDELGGSIALDSSNAGTAFRLTLPWKTDAGAAPQTSQA